MPCAYESYSENKTLTNKTYFTATCSYVYISENASSFFTP